MLRPDMWTKWCFCLKKNFQRNAPLYEPIQPNAHTHLFHPPIESLYCSKWIRLCGKFSGKSNLNAHKWLLLQYINDRELNSYSCCRHIIWWNNNRCSSTVICNGIYTHLCIIVYISVQCTQPYRPYYGKWTDKPSTPHLQPPNNMLYSSFLKYEIGVCGFFFTSVFFSRFYHFVAILVFITFWKFGDTLDRISWISVCLPRHKEAKIRKV